MSFTPNTTLYAVSGCLILDAEGKRIVAKYYNEDYPTTKEQRTYEKSLFQKTRKMNSEIIMFDGQIVVFKQIADVFVYMWGPSNENDLILNHALVSLCESLAMLLGSIEKYVLVEGFDVLVLTLDEIIDGGIILELNPDTVASRVTKRASTADIPIAEQTMAQVLQRAGEQLTRSLLK